MILAACLFLRLGKHNAFKCTIVLPGDPAGSGRGVAYAESGECSSGKVSSITVSWMATFFFVIFIFYFIFVFI